MHDDRAGARAIVAHRRLELAVGQVLDAQVDAEPELAAGPHGADALDVLDAIALAVLDHALGAVLAAEPVVEGQLRALLARVVDVGEAEQVPGDLAGRVVAAVLARQVDALHPQRAHLARVGGLQATRQVHELAVGAGADAARQLLPVEVDGLRQPRQLVHIAGQLARVDPDRIDRRADRQRLAVAVGDRAAVRDDRSHARVARRALAGEEAVLHELQLHRAAHQRRAAREQQREHQRQPQAEGIRPRAAAPRRNASWRSAISTSFEAGRRICRRVLATFST